MSGVKGNRGPGRGQAHFNFKHGMKGKPEYCVWMAVVQRTTNSNHHAWKDYGGRGIRLCSGMREFTGFFSVVGIRPSLEYSIDRYPDNNANYSCGACEECLANGWKLNVRWATKDEQNNNRRDNVPITMDGITKTISRWARERGTTFAAAAQRLKRGVPPEMAFDPAYNGYQERDRPRRVNTDLKYHGIARSGTRFYARLVLNGKFHYLGVHDTQEDAARAFNAAVIRLGAKTKLNVIP